MSSFRFTTRKCFIGDYENQNFYEELILRTKDGKLEFVGGIGVWCVAAGEPSYKVVSLKGDVFTTDKGNRGKVPTTGVKEVERLGVAFRVIDWPAVIKLTIGMFQVKIVGCYAFDSSGMPAFFSVAPAKAKLLLDGQCQNLSVLFTMNADATIGVPGITALKGVGFLPADEDFSLMSHEEYAAARSEHDELDDVKAGKDVVAKTKEAISADLDETTKKLKVDEKTDTFVVIDERTERAIYAEKALAFAKAQEEAMREMQRKMGITFVDGVMCLTSFDVQPWKPDREYSMDEFDFGIRQPEVDVFGAVRRASRDKQKKVLGGQF